MPNLNSLKNDSAEEMLIENVLKLHIKLVCSHTSLTSLIRVKC